MFTLHLQSYQGQHHDNTMSLFWSSWLCMYIFRPFSSQGNSVTHIILNS